MEYLKNKMPHTRFQVIQQGFGPFQNDLPRACIRPPGPGPCFGTSKLETRGSDRIRTVGDRSVQVERCDVPGQA